MEETPIQLAPKVLLIIGNGFDLDMDLETRYIDFVKSDDFKPMLDGNHSKYDYFQDFVTNKNKMQIYPNGLAAFVKKEEEERKWVDLEIDIRDYCLQNDLETNSETIAKELFALRYFLFKYIQSNCKLKIDNHIYTKKASYRVLEKLIEYNADYNIWNFNYTHTCEIILNHKNVSEETIRNHIHYPHGSILEGAQKEFPSIVLGTRYDSKVFKVCPDAIKANMKSNYIDMMNLFQEQLMDANVILIFGHSMGDTDSQYFKKTLKTSRNLKIIANINYTDSKCNEVKININNISDDTFMPRLEDGEIEYMSFSTEGLVERYNYLNANKEAELNAFLKHCFTYDYSNLHLDV
ncbi:MAG: bacteriophage abortive infection AbiH family protein [Paludibacteraceae bacterium]|nr:bacteriophage abortive infection AbiH family protein [Paludibacteraceae bacterium]